LNTHHFYGVVGSESDKLRFKLASSGVHFLLVYCTAGFAVQEELLPRASGGPLLLLLEELCASAIFASRRFLLASCSVVNCGPETFGAASSLWIPKRFLLSKIFDVVIFSVPPVIADDNCFAPSLFAAAATGSHC